jgi:hypothetical protein
MYGAREGMKQWRMNSNTLKQKHGLNEYTGYTKRPEVKLSGVPQVPRLLDALDTFWGVRVMDAKDRMPPPTSAQLKKNLWLDLSQQIHRLHSGKPGVLCTGALWYNFEADVVLDGQDALSLQGFPDVVSKDVDLSASEKRRLAGESYHLGTFASVAFAVYLCPWGAWWK